MAVNTHDELGQTGQIEAFVRCFTACELHPIVKATCCRELFEKGGGGVVGCGVLQIAVCLNQNTAALNVMLGILAQRTQQHRQRFWVGVGVAGQDSVIVALITLE